MDDGNNAARAGKEGGRREHAAHPIPCVCRLLMIKTSQDSQREREGGRPWGNFFLGNIGDGRGRTGRGERVLRLFDVCKCKDTSWPCSLRECRERFAKPTRSYRRMHSQGRRNRHLTDPRVRRISLARLLESRCIHYHFDAAPTPLTLIPSLPRRPRLLLFLSRGRPRKRKEVPVSA